jgi:hypothetical protein
MTNNRPTSRGGFYRPKPLRKFPPRRRKTVRVVCNCCKWSGKMSLQSIRYQVTRAPGLHCRLCGGNVVEAKFV